MTRYHPLVTVILSTLAFTLLGGSAGFALGKFAPGYYRAVFEDGNLRSFNPTQVGIGLGISQGIIGGAVIGVVLVIAQSYFMSRRRLTPNEAVPRAYAPDWDEVPQPIAR